MDAILRLTEDIYAGFHNKKVTVAVMVDFEAAFDKIPPASLILQAMKIGIKGRMLRFTDAFLQDRTIKTKINNTTSEAVSYTHLDVYKRQPLIITFSSVKNVLNLAISSSQILICSEYLSWLSMIISLRSNKSLTDLLLVRLSLCNLFISTCISLSKVSLRLVITCLLYTSHQDATWRDA